MQGGGSLRGYLYRSGRREWVSVESDCASVRETESRERKSGSTNGGRYRDVQSSELFLQAVISIWTDTSK